MRVDIYGSNYIFISNQTQFEIDMITKEFTKNVPNWFMLKKISSNIQTKESFFLDNSIIPIGLWVELLNCATKYNMSIEFGDGFNDWVTDVSITREAIQEFSDELFKNAPYKPKGYQLDAVFNALYYRRDCLEITTNGGKTLICYILFKYMRDVLGLKRILYITPKTNLTTQSSEKFAQYDADCGIVTDWTYGEITGDPKKESKLKKEAAKTADIVFGNYQSLRGYDESFLSTFQVVLNDETHHATSKSIRQIISMCSGAIYKIGMTGTFPKDGSYNSFLIQSFIGPLVYRYTSQELIEVDKFATPVIVYGIKLKYLNEEQRESLYQMRMSIPESNPTRAIKVFNVEQDVCRQNKTRMKYICDMVKRTKKNSLVIFSDVKEEYGYRLYTELKEWSDKNVYYIDGHTKTSVRDQIKQAMEDDTDGNTIIVASIMCFSEGIDISNLWYIFLTETTKSDTSIAQLLGRGMRRYPGKDKTILVDFGDDYSYTPKDIDKKGVVNDREYRARKNYLLRHFAERCNIYKRRKFPLTIKEIDCLAGSLF